jgi:hypothetical protein
LYRSTKANPIGISKNISFNDNDAAQPDSGWGKAKIPNMQRTKLERKPIADAL